MANITDKPMAYICINKGRVKVKNGNTVYMDNGVEFSIELYNPTQNTVLSKISVNNQLISYSGVVLRPGERVFLERYLDNPNRFKFETYNVSGDAEEIKKAIEKNGLIKVEFYNEDTTPQITLTGGINTLTIGDYTPRTYTYTTNSPGGNYNHTTGSPYFGDMTYTTSLSYGTIGGSASQSVNSSIRPASLKRSLTETGRVEQGSQSDQTFQTVNKKFHYFATNVVELHIKPISQMKVEVKDINKMGKYCTKCGKKGKPTDNFCASCGNRF
jgi:hypothetical protein